METKWRQKCHCQLSFDNGSKWIPYDCGKNSTFSVFLSVLPQFDAGLRFYASATIESG